MKNRWKTDGPTNLTVGIWENIHKAIRHNCDHADASINSVVNRAIKAAYQAHSVRTLWDWSNRIKHTALVIKRLSIRLSSIEEREHIQKAADACGLHPTVWIRLVATASHTPLVEHLLAARRHLDNP